MKKLGLLFTIVIMAVLFVVSASAATEGYYTYEVENSEATITSVDKSISGDVTIPYMLGGYSVTQIGVGAFCDCKSLTSVTIGDNITSIGHGAFCYCKGLTSIKIGDNVTSIGDSAFAYCPNLISITIPDKVTNIYDLAFACCSGLTSITIGKGITNIGLSTFYSCTALTDVYYSGTEEQWEAVDIGVNNDSLLNAKIHYHTQHSYIPHITTPATHLAEGVHTFTCECGHSYTEAIEKILEHTFRASKITIPTCENAGYTTYICECGDSYNDNFVPEKGHTYSGQMCTSCGKKCSCNCHKTGFMGFIWKITRFFNKLFKTNKTCACGAIHY